MNDNTLVNFGGEIKSIGEVDGNLARVGGYGILWGTSEQRDLAGDFFTPDTYLGARKGEGVDTLLHHGIPLKAELAQYADIILPPTVKTTIDEHGLFVETVVDLADSYQAKIYDMVSKGKLRWSSGASPHMVKRADNKKAGEIKRWPIVEFSYTPTPCEFRGTEITSLKALFDAEAEEAATEIKGKIFGDYALGEVGAQAIRTLADRLFYGVLYNVFSPDTEPREFGIVTVDPPTTEQRMQYLSDALAEFQEIAASIARAILTGSSPENAETAAKALGEMKSLINLEDGQLEGSRFADHSDRALAAIGEFIERAHDVASHRAQKAGRVLSKENLGRLKGHREALAAAQGALDELITQHETAANDVPAEEAAKAVSEADVSAMLARYAATIERTNGALTEA